jgi:hypothetical protein
MNYIVHGGRITTSKYRVRVRYNNQHTYARPYIDWKWEIIICNYCVHASRIRVYERTLGAANRFATEFASPLKYY